MSRPRLYTSLIASLAVLAAGCSSSSGDDVSSIPPGTDASNSETSAAVFPATVGEPVSGYGSLVDFAVRTDESGQGSTYAVEQSGTIRLVGPNGEPGVVVADLSNLTDESGEQGLLGLAFSVDGQVGYVNYTDLDGRTVVDAFDIDSDGSFLIDSRRTIYTLVQPYRNHNGGDLLVSPDGRHLLVFNGDGGSANDPERVALDPNSDLGKIMQLDLDGAAVPTVRASGLRNPWRASLDPKTNDLWIADVGQNEWEEINVVPFDESEGVSFGWSALEGTVVFNADQSDVNAELPQIVPIHTYPHEDEDCSVSGGAVYRGSSIDAVGTWYVFSDFCSGNVRALCVTDARQACGVVSIGDVGGSVAVLPDSSGELWVLSQSGRLVPIIATE